MQPIRKERMRALIKEEVSAIFQRELKDPRVGFITITHVEVSPDGRYVKIFISVLGSETDIQITMEGIARAQGFIQRRVAQKLQLRYAPQIIFQYDRSLADSMRVQKLLKEIKNEEEGP